MIDDDEPQPEQNEPGEGAASETVSAASPRSARNQRDAIERERLEAEAFWRGVFAGKVGRREMWGLLQQLHPFEERFACGPNGFPQDQATWFQAGEQAFGLRLYHSWARIDRAGVFLMQDEHDPRFAQPTSKRKRRSP